MPHKDPAAAAAYYARTKEHRAAVKAAYEVRNRERIAEYNKTRRPKTPVSAASKARKEAWKTAHLTTNIGWAKNAWRAARRRAQQRGVPCTISWQRLAEMKAVATHCPALGVEMKYAGGARTPNSASLDCINPALGYIPGNIIIISLQANRIKSNGTAEEIRLVADFARRAEAASAARLAELQLAA